MKITTTARLVPVQSPGLWEHARLSVEVFVDGESCGEVTVLSGPRGDVEAFQRGELALGHVRNRWGFGGCEP